MQLRDAREQVRAGAALRVVAGPLVRVLAVREDELLLRCIQSYLGRENELFLSSRN